MHWNSKGTMQYAFLVSTKIGNYLPTFPVMEATKPSQILFQISSIDSKKPFMLIFGGRKGANCKKFRI